jgi:hypothetical protein
MPEVITRLGAVNSDREDIAVVLPVWVFLLDRINTGGRKESFYGGESTESLPPGPAKI